MTLPTDLAAALRALLDEGYELTFAKAPEDCGYLADLTGPLGSHTTGIGADPAAAMAGVWPLGDLGEDQADEDDEDDEPYCGALITSGSGSLVPPVTCGAAVGIFHGHGGGWHHWRGAGTEDSPVELFDAGHAPEVAWRPVEVTA